MLDDFVLRAVDFGQGNLGLFCIAWVLARAFLRAVEYSLGS